MHNTLKPIDSHSSEGHKASGKFDALFSSEQGHLIRSCVFRNANSSNLRGSLLEGNKRITYSIRQDQTYRSKNFMSSPSISASVNYNDKRKSKDLRCRTHSTDLLNPDENKLYHNNRMKKVPETLKPETHTKCEKFRERKNNEWMKSVQKRRENHETFSSSLLQLKQMQER